MTQHDESDGKLAGAAERRARHAAPEGAELHPLIDLSRRQKPGVPGHARPDEDD